MSWLVSAFLADIKKWYVLGVTLNVLKLSGLAKNGILKE